MHILIAQLSLHVQINEILSYKRFVNNPLICTHKDIFISDSGFSNPDLCFSL